MSQPDHEAFSPLKEISHNRNYASQKKSESNPEVTAISQNSSTYESFTFRMAVQLAAPHTWPAAILPVLVATACASTTGLALSIVMVCVLLFICVLMQAAVNTFNDYYDFVKGTDSVDDNVDPTDSVLIYNNVNPQAVLVLAVGFLVGAFMLGGYVVWIAGWIPLAIGVVGALFVVLYSAGKTPVSYLPLGELVSGCVMGGLIPLACYQVLSGSLNPLALFWALPTMLGVGLIMFTNNTCDIEKDSESGRRTLSVLLGREKARKTYHGLVYIWIIAIIVLVGIYFASGLILLPFILLAIYPLVSVLFKNPLTPQARIGAMGQICSLNIALGAFYAAAIFASNDISLSLW